MSTVKQRLVMTLAGAGAPIDRVTITGPTSAVITYQVWATAPQITLGDATLAAFDWSQATHDAWVTANQRREADKLLDALDSSAKLLRGVAAVLVDEINTLRQWLAAFKVQVAAATTLADLKTRVATLPATADRTLIQARTAIVAKIDGGGVDN